MSYPLPLINAYLAGITEVAGVVLLLFGLGTRIISIPLIFVTFVAIFTVHIGNDFEDSNNGFEIPLDYIALLFVLLIYEAGKFSADQFSSKFNTSE